MTSSASTSTHQQRPSTSTLPDPSRLSSSASVVSGRTNGSAAAGASATIADLTAAVRRASGQRPPPLVGCSLTLIDDTVYVFGGRLVTGRTMVNSLWGLNLRSLEWTRLFPGEDLPDAPSPEAATAGPQARYFHSTEAWGRKLVVWGGEGYGPASEADEDGAPLCTLDDLAIWDTIECKWDLVQPTCDEGVDAPLARYAHLAAVCTVHSSEQSGTKAGEWQPSHKERSVLLLIGGQDISNTYLHTAHVLELDTLKWLKADPFDKHIGTYRACVQTSKWTVNPGGPVAHPKESRPPSRPTSPLNEAAALTHAVAPGPDLFQLPFSHRASADAPEPLLLFSNFNFTAVRRDLELLSAPVGPDRSLDTTSLSSLMGGASLPPGLRFPTGAIVGTHLVIYGTFLSHAVNNFSIWALDLGEAGPAGLKAKAEKGEPLSWTRIDPGAALAKGSWNRAFVWKNNVVVLGDRERDIATDYDHRQTNFAHLALVDLEAFGIYQPPQRGLPPIAQRFGLATLAQAGLADFEIVCADGRRLACSRKILCERWSWFAERMDHFRTRATGILNAQRKRHDSAAEEHDQDDARTNISSGLTSRASTVASSTAGLSASTTELRLTPRTLQLPEPSSTVQAFLEYIYSLALCTPAQLDLPVLCALLVFGKSYAEHNLVALASHALHVKLSTKPSAAPAIYESACLASCVGLQIRALKTMLQSPKTIQPKPKPAQEAEETRASA